MVSIRDYDSKITGIANIVYSLAVYIEIIWGVGELPIDRKR